MSLTNEQISGITRPSNETLISYEVLAAVAVILNTICIVIMGKNWKKRNSFDILLANMLVADIFVSVTGIFLASVLLQQTKEIAILRITVLSFIFFGTIQAMTLFVLSISLDRLVAVKYPIRHRNKVTPFKTSMISVLIWCIVGLQLMTLFTTNYFTQGKAKPFVIPPVLNIIFISVTITIGLVFIFSNIEIIRIIYRQKRSMKGVSNNHFLTQSKEVTLSVTTVLIVVSFCFSIGPKIYQTFKQQKTEFGILGIIVNAIMNPVLYFVKSYLEKFFKRKSKSRPIDSNNRSAESKEMTI